MRPEFISSFINGRYAAREHGGNGAMIKRRGFFYCAAHFVPDDDKDEVLVFKRSEYFKVISWGVPLLLCLFCAMVIGLLTIMAFRTISKSRLPRAISCRFAVKVARACAAHLVCC